MDGTGAALADALAARRKGGVDGHRADLVERVLRMALEMEADAGR